MAMWDRIRSFATDALQWIAGTDGAATERITFTIGVIALSAKMAKADGTVTEDEIGAFREIFRIPPQERKNVARVYDLAKQDTAGFETYARQIAKLFDDRQVVLEDLLGALFYIAKADGVVDDSEMEYLRRVADIFGFDAAQFDCIAARHVGEGKADPYTVLGIDHTADDAAVKTAWRRLAKEHHPDRLVAMGVPREFVKVAENRLAAVNAAYERIAASRGL